MSEGHAVVGLFADEGAMLMTFGVICGVSPPRTYEARQELIWRLRFLQTNGQALLKEWPGDDVLEQKLCELADSKRSLPYASSTRLDFIVRHGGLGLLNTEQACYQFIDGVLECFTQGRTALYPAMPEAEQLEHAFERHFQKLESVLTAWKDTLSRDFRMAVEPETPPDVDQDD